MRYFQDEIAYRVVAQGPIFNAVVKIFRKNIDTNPEFTIKLWDSDLNINDTIKYWSTKEFTPEETLKGYLIHLFYKAFEKFKVTDILLVGQLYK